MAAKHVIVVGAGFAGLAAAWELMNRGFAVTVVESSRGAAQKASFATGGWIGPQGLSSWIRLRTRQEKLSELFSQSNPAFGLRWTHSGKKQCHFLLRKCDRLIEAIPTDPAWYTQALRSLADRSFTLFNRLVCSQAISDCRSKGLLHLFSTEKALEEAASGTNRRLALSEGLALNNASCRELEPVIFDNAPVAGALQLPLDFTINEAFVSRELAYAEQMRGVHFLFEEEVLELRFGPSHNITGVKTSKTELPCDAVVLACGSSVPSFLAALPVPIEFLTAPVWSCTVTADAGDFPYRLKTSLFWEEEGILVTALGERIRVSAGPWCGTRTPKEAQQEIKRLTTAGMQLVGGAANWRKPFAWQYDVLTSADNLPIAGAIPGYCGLFVSFAHGMHGAAGALASGEIVADALQEVPANELAALTSPLRRAVIY